MFARLREHLYNTRKAQYTTPFLWYSCIFIGEKEKLLGVYRVSCCYQARGAKGTPELVWEETFDEDSR